MLSSTYGAAALNERTCLEWFHCFKSGDLDVEDRHGGGKETIFKDSELEVSLAEDPCQTQEEVAESLEVIQQAILKRLKAMRMIQNRKGFFLNRIMGNDRIFTVPRLCSTSGETSSVWCIMSC